MVYAIAIKRRIKMLCLIEKSTTGLRKFVCGRCKHTVTIAKDKEAYCLYCGAKEEALSGQ